MTPEKLEKLKQRLLKLDGRLEDELENISEEILSGGIPVGEHDTHVRESKEAEVAIEKTEEQIQRSVKSALNRLEQGNFGKCVDCGQNIAMARLEALPYTPVCVDCELKREMRAD